MHRHFQMTTENIELININLLFIIYTLLIHVLESPNLLFISIDTNKVTHQLIIKPIDQFASLYAI